MKLLHCALITAGLVVLACYGTVVAEEPPTSVLRRIADVVDRDGAHRAAMLGDTITVIEGESGRRSFVISSSGNDVVLSADGRVEESRGESGVDMQWLDSEAVGVLSYTSSTRSWHLVHRFDARRVSTDDISDLLVRFAAAVADVEGRLGARLVNR